MLSNLIYLELIGRHLPGVDVTLWAKQTPTDEIRALIRRVAPTTNIVQGTITAEGKPSSAEFAAAIEQSDLFVLASGGYHPDPVAVWRKLTPKPYGIFANGFDG